MQRYVCLGYTFSILSSSVFFVYFCDFMEAHEKPGAMIYALWVLCGIDFYSNAQFIKLMIRFYYACRFVWGFHS